MQQLAELPSGAEVTGSMADKLASHIVTPYLYVQTVCVALALFIN